MSRIEFRNENYKKNRKLLEPEENSHSKKIYNKRQIRTTKIAKTATKEMNSVQMGPWKALNETCEIAKITKVAKITRIAKFRKAVDENRRSNANEFVDCPQQKSKITNIAKITRIAKNCKFR